MKTASFRTYTGPGRISIARYAPRNTPAGFRVFGGLAPGRWFNSASPEEYIRLYEDEILAKLDPRQTWDRLHDMANGSEPVLLCWETLGPHECGTVESGSFNPKNWCHRRIVAGWFAEAIGEQVDELLTRPVQPGTF